MARFELQLAGDPDFSSLADIGIKLFLPSFLHSFICPFLRADFQLFALIYCLFAYLIYYQGDGRKTKNRLPPMQAQGRF
jgi:hypothetical protein